ncbi:hypothetical protein ALO75_200116 [Pseudomonas syringae pv. coryli]|uniref:Molybdopterin-guanine dinucleotide biosynthesis protein MobC n=1 Tax=Pseudomonas syringae pv. coryli TaxID=317659 RepID=A0A0P9PY00_9PSED|nr:hypothetical protein ALO75_200116 [Pseudomonas syringae pv. coryli]
MEWPKPAITLTSPFGTPARSISTPTISELSGVSSDGLRMTALPAAIAGAICQPQVKIGAFQGVICNTVPSGS